MIRPEDVRKQLDKRPFEAFRIRLTDGEAYDGRYPDLCVVDRTTAYVAAAWPWIFTMFPLCMWSASNH